MAAWVARLAKTGDGMPVRQVQSVSASLNHALPQSFLCDVSPALCDQMFAHDIRNAVQIAFILSLKVLP